MAEELVFVVDDDTHLLRITQVMLEKRGYRVMTFESGEACLEKLDENPATLLLDMVMPGMDGVETLKKIKEVNKDLPVIMVTSVNEVETAIKVIKMGAYDYLLKPVDEARLFTTLEKAIEQNALVRQVRHLQGELGTAYQFPGIIGGSRVFQQVWERVQKVMDSKASVLIQGESGTGKELLARAIHYNSPFAQGLFVDINCGAIPETLQESELFGHRKGAFTGAVESRTGKLELADGGTLFLDEVGEMNQNTQTKLLRFLQEKNFERVGENQKIKVNTRVIAATNKDLKQEVERGTFREDLYYRLAVFPVDIPPLRERQEDIPGLAVHFLQKYREELGKEVTSIAPEAMEELLRYPWPGNVRQLENAIYQAMILTETSTLDLDCLPSEIRERGAGGRTGETQEMSSHLPPAENPSQTPGEGNIVPMKELEKQAIANALKITRGNIPQAARELGLSRSTFYRMVKKYGLH